MMRLLHMICALILSITLSFTAGSGPMMVVRAESVDTEETEPTKIPAGFYPYMFGGEYADDLTVSEPEGFLDLGSFDFGELKAGFLCLKTKLSGADRAEISFYLDEEEESFAGITVSGTEKNRTPELPDAESPDSGNSKTEPPDAGNSEEEFFDAGNGEEDAGNGPEGSEAAPEVPEFETLAVLLQDREITGSHSLRMSWRIQTPSENGASPSEDNAELVLNSLFFAEDSIPVLEICIDESRGSIKAMNGDQAHETKCYGSMNLMIPAGYEEEYSGTVYEELTTETYELDYIRGRGNSTWGRSKKPYRIKLENKEDILGMGKEKNWVLLANYYDITMLRNKITYDIADQFMPEGSFIPQSAFVQVIMNGKYLGLYALTEQIRIGKERLNIDDLEDLEGKDPEDEALLTGGYLLNMENVEAEGRIVKTQRYVFPTDSPEPEYFSDKEYEYIRNYLNELEDRIYGAEDGEAVSSCEELLDIDSYIDYYLIQEFCLNGDAYRTDSTHFYKVRNGKLYFGPLWDFDYVSWAGDKLDVEGWVSADYAPWFVPLLHDDAFRERLMERWEILKEILTAYISDGGTLDRYADSIYTAQLANYTAVSSFIWDEEIPGFTEELGDPITFDSEIRRLKTWISERLAWVDANIDELRPSHIFAEFRDGDRLVHKLMLDRDEQLTENLLPAKMRKEGYRFTGWSRVLADGSTAPLAEEDPMDDSADLLIYQAEWEPYDLDTELKELRFTEDIYEMEPYAYVDLLKLVITEPEDFDPVFLSFSIECDPENSAYLSEDALSLMESGEVNVTVTCGSHEATCRIIIMEEHRE